MRLLALLLCTLFSVATLADTDCLAGEWVYNPAASDDLEKLRKRLTRDAKKQAALNQPKTQVPEEASIPELLDLPEFVFNISDFTFLPQAPVRVVYANDQQRLISVGNVSQSFSLSQAASVNYTSISYWEGAYWVVETTSLSGTKVLERWTIDDVQQLHIALSVWDGLHELAGIHQVYQRNQGFQWPESCFSS